MYCFLYIYTNGHIGGITGITFYHSLYCRWQKHRIADMFMKQHEKSEQVLKTSKRPATPDYLNMKTDHVKYINVHEPNGGCPNGGYCKMETFSALLALCEGNPPVTGGFPSQRPVTRSFDVLFDLRRWFETPLRSLWRHCKVTTELSGTILMTILHVQPQSSQKVVSVLVSVFLRS